MNKDEKLIKDNAYSYIKNLVKIYKLESYCFDRENTIELEQGCSEVVYQKQVDFILTLFKDKLVNGYITEYEFTLNEIGFVTIQA